MHMIKRLVSLLAVAAGIVGGALVAAQPAEAAPGCAIGLECAHDTVTSNPFWTASSSAPRNTCIDNMADNLASFITENTGVQWWLFRTNDCGGSHIVVHANTNLDLRFVSGWDNAVAAAMRTSTVG